MYRRKKQNNRLSPDEWFPIREQVLTRDENKCTRCGENHMLEVDHIRPISLGGSNSLENLRTLCFRCHCLRLCPSHRGMISKGLALGIIDENWRNQVWS